MKTKKCAACKEKKDITAFNKDYRGLYKVYYICRDCVIQERRTITGLILTMYSSQTSNRNKKRGKAANYTKREFEEWLLKQSLFFELYNNWVRSNYNRKLRPSIDRDDNSIGYTLDNIQLMTWEKNHEKACEDMRNSNLNKSRVPIMATNLLTGKEEFFESMFLAAKKLGVLRNTISLICSIKQKQSKGYTFCKVLVI